MSDGQISVFYSPETSLNGAKLPMSKGPRKKVTIEDVSAAESAAILTPYAEGEIVSGKRKREKDRNDPRKSRRPELPLTGPGKGGRVGASATQHVVQNLVRDTTRDEDVSGSMTRRRRVIPGVTHRRRGPARGVFVPGQQALRGPGARPWPTCRRRLRRTLTCSLLAATRGVAQVRRHIERPEVDRR
jgi:hypothetical protein